MHRKLHIVDVFADRPCAGNMLSVVLGAKGLSTKNMQSLARELGAAETAFVMASAPVAGHWPLRVFTSTRELPFAGSSALGAAHVLQAGQKGSRSRPLMLDFPSGSVPVVTERLGRRDLYWLRHPVPLLGATLSRVESAALLGLRPADIDGKHPGLELTSGDGYFVIPVRTRAALARASLDVAALRKYAARLSARSVVAFAPGASGPRNHYTARTLFDWHGEGEDAGNGSAGVCLAAWLVETRYCRDDAVDVRVEQGAELGRPSLVHLRAIRTSRGVEVRVGGSVVDVVRGDIVAAGYVATKT